MNKNIYIMVWMNKLILLGLMLLCVGFATAYAPRLSITYPVDGLNYTDVSQVKFNLSSPYNITSCNLNMSVSSIPITHYLVGSPTPIENIVSHNFDKAGTYDIFVECTYFNEYGNTTGVLTSDVVTFSANPSSSSPGHTRYLVDANGNVVSAVYNNQVVQPEKKDTFLSIGGGSSFNLGQWFKDLWKNIFGGQ